MRSIAAGIWIVLAGVPCLAAVGPDLSAGTDVEFFTKLRLETAQREGFNPLWNTDPERTKIMEAFQAGEVDRVLELADPWLKKLPIDSDVHLMAAMCFKEKKDFASYAQHLNVFYGLLGSVTSQGDGLSEETAFRVVSIAEEYSLVQEIGGRVKRQALLGEVDRLEVERAGGKTLTLYFDVSIHLKALAKSLRVE
jgi:hypothetical protein